MDFINPILVGLVLWFLKKDDFKFRNKIEKFFEENKKQHTTIFDWLGIGITKEKHIKGMNEVADFHLSSVSDDNTFVVHYVTAQIIQQVSHILDTYELDIVSAQNIKRSMEAEFKRVQNEINENSDTIPILVLKTDKAENVVKNYIDKSVGICLDVHNDKIARFVSLSHGLIGSYVERVVEVEQGK